jgi:hypothetical protein
MCTIVDGDMVGSVRPHLLNRLVDGVRHHFHIHFGGCVGCGREDAIDMLDALKGCLRSCASVVFILGTRSSLLRGGTRGTRRALHNAA